jgi:hypothetical protein
VARAAPLWQVVGISLDWRDVASGEQLLLDSAGEVFAVSDEHSPFLLGSQIGFLARRNETASDGSGRLMISSSRCVFLACGRRLMPASRVGFFV